MPNQSDKGTRKSRRRFGLLIGALALLAAVFVVRGGFDKELARAALVDDRRKPGDPLTIRREGAVDLRRSFDLSGLSVPKEEIHTLLPRDAIPALTDPETVTLQEAGWLDASDRLVVYREGDRAYAVPMRVLDWHEIINTSVGGRPIALTYCPLCDSASVLDRRVAGPGGSGERTLEFGVSGALYNSNVLMYDRQDMGLWSQLGMEAVSGPLVGTRLRHLPFSVMTRRELERASPDARIVSIETGHEREYTGASPFASYFSHDAVIVPIEHMGVRLPPKTLGVGVLAGGASYFLTAEAIGDRYELETPLGVVELRAGEGGVTVDALPDGVHAVQTFYYAWEAFFRDTDIIAPD